jgi:hypothetical protein
MEEIKSFRTYLADRELKERSLSRMKQLERESTYYESRIKKDLRKFINEGSIRQDCSMRKRYTNLLEKSLKKKPACISSANLSHFSKYL